MKPAVLLVVAKAPVPGQAKTRLSPPATPEQAAAIASASLLDTLDAARAATVFQPMVAMTGNRHQAVDPDSLRRALARLTVFPQRGKDFGDRLAAAHADVARIDLNAGLHVRPVLQLGMDTPQVTAELLTESAEPLLRSTVDAVLGPAVDGGWWALGLRDPRHADVLRSVPMSRSDTGALTLAALRSAGLRVELLPELSDVDTMADAIRVAAELPHSRFATAVQQVALGVPVGGVR